MHGDVRAFERSFHKCIRYPLRSQKVSYPIPSSHPEAEIGGAAFRTDSQAALTWVPVMFYTLSDGARYVHHGARATPKVGDFPFFYFYLLIYMPVVSVVCWIVIVLQKRVSR